MRVGLDFDNTIVRYDTLFHKVAVEGGWVPSEIPVSKLAVRDYLRRIGKEDVWIEMQGYVYGPRMGDADISPGAEEFLRWARQCGHSVCIVSHKTRHPFAGPRYDLHEAARAWVEARLADADGPLVEPSAVYFELTKDEKLARIGAAGCKIFVDDLPEILLAPGFPSGTEPMLFDPEGRYEGADLPRLRSFDELRTAVER
jgi:hypothetical protein